MIAAYIETGYNTGLLINGEDDIEAITGILTRAWPVTKDGYSENATFSREPARKLPVIQFVDDGQLVTELPPESMPQPIEPPPIVPECESARPASATPAKEDVTF